MAFTVSNDFTANTKAKAAEVNENFADIETKLNAMVDDSHVVNANLVDTDSIQNSAVTFAKLAAAAVETSADTLSDTDSAVPTSAAVVDYVAANTPQQVNETEDTLTTTVPSGSDLTVISKATAFGEAKTCLIIASFTFGNAAGDSDGGSCTAKLFSGSTELWSGIMGWPKHSPTARTHIAGIFQVGSAETVKATLRYSSGDGSKLYNDVAPATLAVITLS